MFKDNNTVCTLWPSKPERCTVVFVLSKAAAALSIIGCVFVALIILILKKYRLFVQKMILALACSACLESVGYISNGNDKVQNGACRFRGFFCHYFGWATMMWVLMITINMLLTVKQHSNSKYLLWFHLIVWSVSLFWSLLPFINDTYGPAGIWCWIQRDFTAMRFGTWYIPVLAIAISMLGIYLYIIYFVLRETRSSGGAYNEEAEQNNHRYREELKPLLSYPCIYIIFVIPGLIYRIDDAAHPNASPNYALVIICVIFLQSIGSCNAIAFIAFNAGVKEMSWLIIKQHLIALFSKPTVIHKDYVVEDLPELCPTTLEALSYDNPAAEMADVVPDGFNSLSLEFTDGHNENNS